MRIQVVVRRLMHPMLVEVEFTPTLFERLLPAFLGGKRSHSRFASPLYHGSPVWAWDTPPYSIDDETLLAIQNAVIVAHMQAAIEARTPTLRIVRAVDDPRVN